MSMNLHCDVIELWQTPTQITFMCMVQPDGAVPFELKGKKAKHALEIYKQWVRFFTNGKTWKNDISMEQADESVKSHLREIEEATKNKRIKVYVL